MLELDRLTDLVPASVTLPDGRRYDRARVLAHADRVVVFAVTDTGTVDVVFDSVLLSVTEPHDPFAPVRRQRFAGITGVGPLTATRNGTCNCKLAGLRRVDPATLFDI